MTSLRRALAVALAMCLSASAFANAPKRVALVFDDGPVPELAPKLLELFQQEDIRVTFAQVATTMQQHPETSRAMLAAGHEIVNHSHDHRHPGELSDQALRHEIVDAQKAMTDLLGVAPAWYWPPYLEVDDRVEANARAAGIQLFPRQPLVSSDDWNREVSADHIRQKATTGVTDGCVILFHEWRLETYQQLPAILAELRRQGCEFLTFSELHAQRQADAAN